MWYNKKILGLCPTCDDDDDDDDDGGGEAKNLNKPLKTLNWYLTFPTRPNSYRKVISNSHGTNNYNFK